ncbi:MAG: hypothetical protein H6708_18250 [Kofleriaceae bacterium]|nr:hypothetical protein [Kofleriaceae bacterium]
MRVGAGRRAAPVGAAAAAGAVVAPPRALLGVGGLPRDGSSGIGGTAAASVELPTGGVARRVAVVARRGVGVAAPVAAAVPAGVDRVAGVGVVPGAMPSIPASPRWRSSISRWTSRDRESICRNFSRSLPRGGGSDSVTSPSPRITISPSASCTANSCRDPISRVWLV